MRKGAQASAAAPRSLPRPQPVALIGEERAGLSVRPSCLRLANRYLQVAPKLMVRAFGVSLDLHVAGATVRRGQDLKDELAGMWLGALKIEGRPGEILVAVGGPLIELVADRLLGSPPDRIENRLESSEEAGPTRPPSAAAVGVFACAGSVLVKAFVQALRDEQTVEAEEVNDPAAVEALKLQFIEGGILISTDLTVEGPAPARIHFISRPETVMEPRQPPRTYALAEDAIEAALGGVMAEILVELGHAQITIRELSRLRAGTVITLNQPTDALLPIQVQGVVKAYGTPVVDRGAMAVQVVAERKGTDK